MSSIAHHLSDPSSDPLLALIGLHAADKRSSKVDLGVGVYRDDAGQTPVMRAVKEAERHLVEVQASKSYLGPEGDPDFVARLAPLIFGAAPSHFTVGVQTPGGTGALRLAAELVASAGKQRTLWMSAPTWPNHPAIAAAVGLQVREYPYYDRKAARLRFDEMIATLGTAKAGDVVLLHACCHNPTGADLSEEQWRDLTVVMADRRLIPLLDLAYQGLGRGLEPDSFGVRTILAGAEEAFVAYSCDKNFAVYRERTGALYYAAPAASLAAKVHGNLLALARAAWSMPPDHGAAVVRTILESELLTQLWRAELDDMRRRIAAVRQAAAAAEPKLAHIEHQNGLFSLLDMPPGTVEVLRRDDAIYMAGSGRINVAGLSAARAADCARRIGKHL
jgi:aromatic-amino-acid transaminase